MFSDERMGANFLPALAQLPKGAGLVFRHYQLEKCERRALFLRARRIARARRIIVVLAGSARQARAWRADGVHGGVHAYSREGGNPAKQEKLGSRFRGSTMLNRNIVKTAPVHNLRELVAAERGGADLIFISPVFATRSHPGSGTLGRRGFTALAVRANVPVVALGGMNARRASALTLAYGWAGIDSWLPAQSD